MTATVAKSALRRQLRDRRVANPIVSSRTRQMAKGIVRINRAFRAKRGPWSRRRDARTTTKAGLRRTSRASPSVAPPRLKEQPGRQTAT